MSGKLFAFNVSKEVERADEKAREQWVGDQIARATIYGYCTGADYGVDGCFVDLRYICHAYGSTGYYICDNY